MEIQADFISRTEPLQPKAGQALAFAVSFPPGHHPFPSGLLQNPHLLLLLHDLPYAWQKFRCHRLYYVQRALYEKGSDLESQGTDHRHSITVAGAYQDGYTDQNVYLL